jgi:uncharacterized protein
MLRFAGLIVIAVSLAIAPALGQVKYGRGVLTITQAAKHVTLQVEVAETPEARAQGLMFRTHMDENAGMLFIFESTINGAFWMKNTLIPLTIAFIDEGWRIVDIKDMAVARDPHEGPFELYASEKAYQYALEVNQGFLRRHGITAGAKVSFTAK